MVNTNHLHNYNKNASETPIDNFFHSFGGTTYNNIYTPAPDTGRSLATLWSGLPPYLNGCDKRGKFAKYFLKTGTIFDHLIKDEVKIKIVSEREHIFPNSLSDSIYFISDIGLLGKPEENQFSFIDILDSHHVLDDIGYTFKGIKQANAQTRESLDYIFSQINKYDYDKIIFTSDHGHLLHPKRSMKLSPSIFLGPQRSRILLHIWDKYDESFSLNNSFGSIIDLNKYITELFIKYSHRENKDLNSDSSFSPSEPSYILIEDNLSLVGRVYANNNIWNFRDHEKNNIIYVTEENIDLELLKRLDKDFILPTDYTHISTIISENLDYHKQNKALKDDHSNLKKIHWYYFNKKKRHNYSLRRIGHLVIPIKLRRNKVFASLYTIIRRIIHF